MSTERGPGRTREWLYRQLLRAHPAAFRRRHADELLATFREAWRERAHGRGPTAGLRFWLHLGAGELGGGLRERARAVRRRTRGWGPSLPDLALDLRFSLRIFRRHPGLTTAVVLTLGIGMGGAAAVFGTFYDVYRGALPFRDGDRLVRLRSYVLGPDGAQRAYNFPQASTVLVGEENRSFTGVVAMNGGSLALRGEASPERVEAVEVTAGWTRLMGITPVLGRPFSPEEEKAGADAGVALISHSVWQTRFGGDPDVVGRTLAVDGGQLTIVGVMPPRFHYPYGAQVWTPFRLDRTNFRNHDLNVVCRLRDGVDLAAARADMDRIYAGLKQDNPGAATDDGIQVRTVRQDFIRDHGSVVQALLVAVAFFLLLACVNVANLLAAHFVSRRREMGIRAALGAGAGRQLRQTVTETLLLFAAGGLLGLLLSGWLADVLLVLLPEVFRVELGVGGGGVTAPVMLFTAGVAAVAGTVSGLAAAWRAQRADLGAVLHEGGRGTSGAANRLQDALVVAELALSVVLLIGAGVMLDHFRRLQGRDLGFQPEGVATLQASLESPRYDDIDVRERLVHTLEERLGGLPGVESVGITTVNPICCGDWAAPVEAEGHPISPGAIAPRVRHRYVTPGYFATLGIPLEEGRIFPDADRPGTPPEVLVDATLARRMWPDRDAVGKRIRVARDGAAWKTVVGVVGDTYDLSDYDEGWYLPFYQEPTGASTGTLHLMLRLQGEGALALVRKTIAEVDPDLPIFDITSMDTLMRKNLAQDRLGALMTVVFAAFGLLLAVVGLYGLMAYLVGLRTREIGTRIALGASRANVLGLILRRAAQLVAAGCVVGAGLALVLNRVLTSIVVGARMLGPEIFAPVLVLLIACAAGAVSLPALRASRVDPVRAFQAD